MRCLLFAVTVLLALPAYPQAMRQAAERLLAAVPEGARAKIVRPFDDRDRLDWTTRRAAATARR